MNRDVRMKGFSQRAPVAEALDWLAKVEIPTRTETAVLNELAGRVLARNVTSEVNVPGFRRSMMDGYAVIAAEVLGANAYNPIPLSIVHEVLPGQSCPVDIRPGETVRVMTGAEVPATANAVVPVEQAETQPDDKPVSILSSIAEQKNVARPGEDIQLGETVLRKGRRLRPQDAGLLSSIGVNGVEVFSRPRVRIIVTGNELLPAGHKPRGVQVVDSNSIMLEALVQRDGGDPDFPGILPDDKKAIQEAMQDPSDVLLVAGGSSTGKEDFAPGIIAEFGELSIHGIAMRPSSPAGMGRFDQRPVFLLPGNPVSCLCAYDFFARYLIRKMAGLDPGWPYQKTRLPLREKISSAIGRTDYARVRIVDNEVEPIAISGASILSSTIKADGFCILPQDSEGFPAGHEIEVFLYEWSGQPS